LALNYDYNKLDVLKQGAETLNDDTRQRLTRTSIFQASYTPIDKLSIESFLSFVNQERSLTSGATVDQTSGFGDVVLLAKYKLLENKEKGSALSAGLGVKLPTGKTDLATDSGITLNADLQPGSGAIDQLFWSRFSQQFSKRPSASVFASAIYSNKGENDEYLQRFTYHFGNEIQAMLGVSDQFVLGSKLIDPSLSFRYRNAAEDEQNEIILPNTGGQWIFAQPAVLLWLNSALGIRLASDIPVYSKVDGLQLSPTYRLNGGIFVPLNFSSDRDL